MKERARERVDWSALVWSCGRSLLTYTREEAYEALEEHFKVMRPSIQGYEP